MTSVSHTGRCSKAQVQSASTLFEVMEPASHGRPQAPRATAFSALFLELIFVRGLGQVSQPVAAWSIVPNGTDPVEAPSTTSVPALVTPPRGLSPNNSCPPAHEGRIAPSRSWIAVLAVASVLGRRARVIDLWA